ncbi:P-loop containing nucleoside triphosphate hydrolase protein [Mycena metata]|uniref:P-loop containing nucleoside triphosphate hydrolase protein n=1 Tax=Mycena metata TaxID=1033252 RepID=A0AAD7JMV5_9AGAR|nr:P-loop containing nucleoside triphosphate hydrolase protein [Mycena metata]
MASPWALENFLAYGTLSVRLDTDGFAHLHHELPVSPRAEDDWYLFTSEIRKHLPSQEDHAVIMELEFLVAQRFISVSFLLVDDNVIFRIYLIPYDLPRVQGQLRVRKDEILTPARRLLKGLLLKISRSLESWEGRCLPEPPLAALATTLSEIYEDLPSPEGLITVNSTPVTRRLLNFSDNLENLGVSSTLYRYQRRSVAAMVQKEMDLNDDTDPLYLALRDMDGKPFFFQPGTTEVLLERPLVAPCRGGILCEELGTGKTVMVLGLILATRYQLSDPAPSIMNTRPVLTPLAFRHFPSDEFAAARTGFFPKNKANKRTSVPSLVEILLHKMATNPVTFVSEAQTDRYANLKEAVDNLEHYAGPRKDNLPFYLDYQEEPMDNERENKRARSRQTRGPRMLHLTSATLVVVPENLLLQWEQECSLHCEDSLRMLVLRRGDPMPSARVLASEYDIILMSYSRFTGENKPNENREAWRPCTCPEYAAVRVPKCECKPPAYSPLLQVRWKRLVIDEGHVSASLTTVLTPFTKLLSVERRWIVTGTPTTNLLGLSLGKKVNDASETSELGSRAPSEGPEDMGHIDDVSVLGATRVWTKDDGEDLTKLGKMIAHFVGVPQLLANPQLMNTHVKEALLDRRGPRPGAMDVLMQFMSSVMIRHRISQVEEEVKLPPATQELVLLDLDPLMIKSYNALQAVIAVNAITSARKDQDYLFHRENRAFLQETVQNMGQILFWRTDDNYYNADELMRNYESLMNKLPARTSPEDVALINNAFHHIRLAGGDPLWRGLQSHEDVPFLIHNLSPAIFQAWTRISHPVESHDSRLCGYIHPDRLRGLRNLVLGQPLITEGSLIETGAYVAEQDTKQRAAYQEHLKRKKGSKPSSSRGHEESASRLKATQAAKKAADPNTVREMQQELAVHIGIDSDISMPQLHDRTRVRVNVPSVLVSKSHLANTRLGSSGSSKLNFIIDEVMKYSAAEKILIFSNSELSLAHISEALDLIGVDFLRFSTQIPARVRQQFVLTFETSEKYRVFLMDLKHGARGLNLVSASRVIFCEPVWQADVESQAIKRCHRIGQTRPITVKTLAIRGTPEENMAIRRIVLKDSPEKVPKNFIDDDDNGGMRSFIANPKFITDAPTMLPVVEFPVVKIPPVDQEDAVMPDVEEEPRARSIRFAADDSPSSSSKRPRDSSEDKASPSKRRVRLILPDPSSSSPPKPPKPKAQVRFA